MKNFILVIVVLLLAAAAWFIVNRQDDSTTIDLSNREFKVEDASSKVRKIFLAYRTGQQVLLEKKDNRWIYNKDYRARQEAVQNILDLLETVDLQYIPPESARKNVLEELARSGIKVEIYTSSLDEPSKVFYVGGPDTKGTATFFLMENSTQPFAMEIPGLQGGLRVRFRMDDDDWKDRRPYYQSAEDISSFQILYPKQQSKSFTLSEEGGKYTVSHPFDKSQEPFEVDKSVVHAYLDKIDDLTAESYINEHPKRDSISALIPFSIVEMNTKEGVKSAKFIPLVNKLTPTAPIFRLAMDCSWGDFMLIQEGVFRDLFVEYDYWKGVAKR